MADGKAPYILEGLADFAMGNYPGNKVTPPGFMQMLLNHKPSLQTDPNILKPSIDGHFRDVKVKYQARSTPSQATTTDNCDIDVIPAYKETTISQLNIRKMGIYIPDELIRLYETNASGKIQIGQPSASIMMEFYRTLFTQLNGLIGAINTDLLSMMATNFGKNAVTGSAAATAIALDPNSLSMNNGIVKLLSDATFNEMILSGELLMAGNGQFNNYMLAKQFQKSTNGNGFTNEAAGIKWYNDMYSVNAWGANRFGVFAPYSVGMVEANSYVGNFAGVKGGSEFFTLPIPVQLADGTLTALVLDAQLKFYDCNTEVMVGGVTQTITKGWVLQLMKHFSLFTIPMDAYQAGDRLSGTNGALLYEAS